MAPDVAVTHLPILLRADPARVVLRPFIPADDPPRPGIRTRAQSLADRVTDLDRRELDVELARVMSSLSDRHRDVEQVFLRRFQEVSGVDRRAKRALTQI